MSRTVRAAIVTAVVVILATAAALYVRTADEDTAPVWVCSVMGNRECGPHTPPVIIGW